MKFEIFLDNCYHYCIKVIHMITHLKIRNFKKFVEIDIDFNDNLTILVGDNESGKSTILDALSLVLQKKIDYPGPLSLDNSWADLRSNLQIV